MLLYIWFLVLHVTLVTPAQDEDYRTARKNLVDEEEEMEIGGLIKLSDKEEQVNKILMEKKHKELDAGFENQSKFLPGKHIFNITQDILKSEVFKFIQTIPKGANLHGHAKGMASFDYVSSLLRLEKLYACFINGSIRLHFFKAGGEDKNCTWRKISDWQRVDIKFDAKVKSQMSLVRSDYANVYANPDRVWEALGSVSKTVDPLIGYKPVFQRVFQQILKESYDDNLLYLEFRSDLLGVYDLDGKVYTPLEVVGLFQETLELFMKKHDDFLGAKLIYSPDKPEGNQTIKEYVKIVKEIQEKYPKFLAGFDLVGNKRFLQDFKDDLVDVRVPLMLHAGESNWHQKDTQDLFDAIVLNVERIGNGFSIPKHPKLGEIIKQKSIPIEVIPISNQVFGLVDDMRNHPGNFLIPNNFTIVIGNDYPGYFGTKSLSYDWYMTFLGMTSRDTGLKFLKQIALNSLVYSELDDKDFGLKLWEKRWDRFLDCQIKVCKS